MNRKEREEKVSVVEIVGVSSKLTVKEILLEILAKEICKYLVLSYLIKAKFNISLCLWKELI